MLWDRKDSHAEHHPNHTLLSCMSLLAPFFSSTSVASTLLTAAAQWRADLPAGKPKNFVKKQMNYPLKSQDGQSTLRGASNCSTVHSMWTYPEPMFALWKLCDIPKTQWYFQHWLSFCVLFICCYFKITCPESHVCCTQNPSTSNPVFLLHLSQDFLTKLLWSSLKFVIVGRTSARESAVLFSYGT